MQDNTVNSSNLKSYHSQEFLSIVSNNKQKIQKEYVIQQQILTNINNLTAFSYTSLIHH